jgi:hypothetical protein
MEPLDTISKRDLREFLTKGWMTHDAMWFYHCSQEIGMEKTNKINRSAVRSMAAIEAKRVSKLMGLKVESFDDLKRILNEGFAIIKADFMNFTYEFPEQNVFRWNIFGCFAYDGIKGLGLIDQYECGIKERAYGWMDGLGIEFEVQPDTLACTMHTTGKCVTDIKLKLDK